MNEHPEKDQNVAIERERKRRQKSRNLAVFFALAAFVALVYGVTIVKIKLGYGP